MDRYIMRFRNKGVAIAALAVMDDLFFLVKEQNGSEVETIGNKRVIKGNKRGQKNETSKGTTGWGSVLPSIEGDYFITSPTGFDGFENWRDLLPKVNNIPADEKYPQEWENVNVGQDIRKT